MKVSKRENLGQRFCDYCQQTSLHGWQYLSSENGKVKKLLWMLIIAVCYGYAGYSIWNTSKDFKEATTITTIESTTKSLDDISFPTLYVCNLNIVTKSFLKMIDVDKSKQNLIIEEFVTGRENNTTLSKENQEIIKEISQKLKDYSDLHPEWNLPTNFPIYPFSMQPCEDMFLKVKWSDKPVRTFFRTKYWETTEYGICCLIVPYFDFEVTSNYFKNKTPEEKWNIPTGFANNGLQSGLMATIDLEHYNHAVTKDSYGFKLGLTHPKDKIIMRNNGFDIHPGVLSEIAVVPTTTNTTEDAIERFDPIDRDCYHEKEVNLKYLTYEVGYRYSLQNCMYNALMQRVAEQCNCILYLGYDYVKDKHPKLDICYGSQKLHCAITLLNRLGNAKLDMVTYDTSGKNITCRERCEVQQNDFTISNLIYPHIQTFQDHWDLCLIMEKIGKICKDLNRSEVFERYYVEGPTCQEFLDYHEKRKSNCGSTIHQYDSDTDKRFLKFYHQYATENIAKVAIYLRDPYHTSFIKDVKISFTDFISNLGGLLGLCLGLSFFSIAEIGYHCLKCIFKL